MRFTIITPSFNQLGYLKRCVASVADQVAPLAQRPEVGGRTTRVGVLNSDFLPSDICSWSSESEASLSVHHHVQDGGSADGTCEFLKKLGECGSVGDAGLGVNATNSNSQTPNAKRQTLNYSFSYSSKKDEGMYDALNRGIDFVKQNQVDECSLVNDKDTLPGAEEEPPNNHEQLLTMNSRDSVIAWLNCDEQYLPGTLGKVADYFQCHPETDLLFGGVLIVDENGELLSCRKAMPMRKLFLEASYLYNLSCAMFFRQSLWEKLGGFDTSFKNAGDEDLIRRALKIGAKTAVLDDYLATFTYDGNNLSSDPVALEEHQRLKDAASTFSKAFKLPLNLLRLTEKWIRRGHRQSGPIEYAIYVDEGGERKTFRCENPSCTWPGHSKPYLAAHRLQNRG